MLEAHLLCRGDTPGRPLCTFGAGCERAASHGSAFCRQHDSAASWRRMDRCASLGCRKVARPTSRFCTGHGGGSARCQERECHRHACLGSVFCAAHGGERIHDLDKCWYTRLQQTMQQWEHEAMDPISCAPVSRQTASAPGRLCSMHLDVFAGGNSPQTLRTSATLVNDHGNLDKMVCLGIRRRHKRLRKLETSSQVHAGRLSSSSTPDMSEAPHRRSREYLPPGQSVVYDLSSDKLDTTETFSATSGNELSRLLQPEPQVCRLNQGTTDLLPSLDNLMPLGDFTIKIT